MLVLTGNQFAIGENTCSLFRYPFSRGNLVVEFSHKKFSYGDLVEIARCRTPARDCTHNSHTVEYQYSTL